MLFKKKPKQNLRNRRHPVDPETRPISSSYSYRTSRSEQQDNLGRDANRDNTPKPPSNHIGGFLIKRFGLVILVIALVFSVVNIATLSPDTKVVSLTGNEATTFLHDESQYKNASDKLLTSSIWNKNKITVNVDQINKEIVKQYPELSSVNLSLPLLSKRPILYIQTAEPALVLNSQQGSFVIDNSGKALILKDNVPKSTDLALPIVNDQSGLKVNLNKQVLSSTNVSFIRTVVDQLKAKKYEVSTMTLPAAASELDVGLIGQPYIIKYNLRTNNAREQTGTFLATINKLQSQNITPAKYVDVRVNGRAYYQ